MKLKTKKIIAREFLLLIAVLTASVIGFIGTYPYNSYWVAKSKSSEKEINTKQKIIDSLNLVLGKSLNKGLDTTSAGLPIFNMGKVWQPPATDPEVGLAPPPPKILNANAASDTDEYGIPIKRKKIPVEKIYDNLLKAGYTVANVGTKDEFVQKLQNLKNGDKLYKVLQREGFTEVQLGTEEEFLKAISIKDNYWNERIRIYNQINDIGLQITKLNQRKSDANLKILTIQEQQRFAFLFFIILLTGIFGLRYLGYTVKYSLKILKQETE